MLQTSRPPCTWSRRRHDAWQTEGATADQREQLVKGYCAWVHERSQPVTATATGRGFQCGICALIDDDEKTAIVGTAPPHEPMNIRHGPVYR
jgi:hypothetical protein